MAKLYFRYSAMNSGKSTALIQVAYNYQERGMRAVILKPAIDSKGDDTVVSRLGINQKVDALVAPDELITTTIQSLVTRQPKLDCILIDEAQFLTAPQVDELFWFAASGTIPVMAYGLRTDFSTTGFPGATRLLELAHEIQEIKTICRCGRKAVLNGRKKADRFIFEGEQVAIDGENSIEYESLCGACYARFKQESTTG